MITANHPPHCPWIFTWRSGWLDDLSNDLCDHSEAVVSVPLLCSNDQVASEQIGVTIAFSTSYEGENGGLPRFPLSAGTTTGCGRPKVGNQGNSHWSLVKGKIGSYRVPGARGGYPDPMMSNWCVLLWFLVPRKHYKSTSNGHFGIKSIIIVKKTKMN